MTRDFSIRILDAAATDAAGVFRGRIEAGGLEADFEGHAGPVDPVALASLWAGAVRRAAVDRAPACLFTSLDLDPHGRGEIRAFALIPSELADGADAPDRHERGIFLSEIARTVARDPADLAEMLYRPEDPRSGPPYLLDLARPEGFYRYLGTGLAGLPRWFAPDDAFAACLADHPTAPAGPQDAGWFETLNEIGIIAQLSRAAFESRMPEGLAVPQFSVLNHFVRLGDGKSPLELARAFQVPKTTMTHTLAALETRGLVETRANPADGRSKLVFITRTGRGFRERAIAALAPDIGRLAARVDPDLPARLLPDLRELRRFLDADRDGPDSEQGDPVAAGRPVR